MKTNAGLPGTSSQHQHPLTESRHHADPLSDRESSFLTGYDKISAGGPTCTLIMSRAPEHERCTCWQACSLILSARAFSLPSGTVAGLPGPGSQLQRPLIESEYYAAPLRYRQSSTSTECGKISAGGAIYSNSICLALTHSGWAARDKLAASTFTY
jgi:hypothetical protein